MRGESSCSQDALYAGNVSWGSVDSLSGKFGRGNEVVCTASSNFPNKMTTRMRRISAAHGARQHSQSARSSVNMSQHNAIFALCTSQHHRCPHIDEVSQNNSTGLFLNMLLSHAYPRHAFLCTRTLAADSHNNSNAHGTTAADMDAHL